MIPYYGDFAEDATVRIVFNTFTSNDPTASATITNLADADIKVHKDGGLTQIVTDGATIIIDFDSITGNHMITIDTSVHADYAIGSDYFVRIEGTTVDAGTINSWVGQFSIENRGVAGAKAVWDRVISKALHDIAQSAAKVLRLSGNLTQIDGAVSGTPSTTAFDTNLSQVDGFWDDAVLVFSNGATNAGRGITVATYVNANGRVTFDAIDAWAVTPINGDDFVMFANHVHPVSQIAEEARIEMDANSTKLASINTNVNDIETDTVEIGVAGGGLTDLGGMSTGMKAEVNVEAKDVLVTDTHAEPSSVPAATSSIKDKIGWVTSLARNKGTQTSTTKTLRNDADSGDIGTSTVSDDGTTFTREKWS